LLQVVDPAWDLLGLPASDILNHADLTRLMSIKILFEEFTSVELCALLKCLLCFL
jgi:hypothetical protein